MNVAMPFDKKYVPGRCAQCRERTSNPFFYEPYIESNKRIDSRNKLILRFCSIKHLYSYLNQLESLPNTKQEIVKREKEQLNLFDEGKLG